MVTLDPKMWLFDTRATNHMCSDHILLHDMHDLPIPIDINLPNSTSIVVTTAKSYYLNKKLIMTNVLQVQST